MKEKNLEKSKKKAEVRAKIVEMYQAGKAVEEIAEEMKLSKQKIIGVLVYEGVYKKPKTERQEIIEALKNLGFIQNFNRVPTNFLKELLAFLKDKINN